ncbi:MAG: hypothetical protein IPG04_15110 [Polyangiaceae bacterium]|nr:hypothetical protein [Polyangiaceae bacterium]
MGSTVKLGLTALALVACTTPELLLCDRIPDGGCPLGRGGSCDDEVCAGLYDCIGGEWTLVEACEGGGGQGGAGVGGGGGGGGSGGCDVPEFDHTGQTFGCSPDLQPPDCPVEAAEVCGDPCLTECVDFFLCLREGWQSVGYCDEGGQLVNTQGLR